MKIGRAIFAAGLLIGVVGCVVGDAILRYNPTIRLSDVHTEAPLAEIDVEFATVRMRGGEGLDFLSDDFSQLPYGNAKTLRTSGEGVIEPSVFGIMGCIFPFCAFDLCKQGGFVDNTWIVRIGSVDSAVAIVIQTSSTPAIREFEGLSSESAKYRAEVVDVGCARFIEP